VVSVSIGGDSKKFVRLPDGSFARPLMFADDLTDNMDGTYTLTTQSKVEFNFDSDGNIATIVFPFGMTITYTYTSGKLTGVSNGLGRSLTLSYTGDRLTSVSDGNGRGVTFDVDNDNNLVTVTNAESDDTTYEYDAPGRLTKIYLPANPNDPIVSNTYDSLDRVKEQSDAYSVNAPETASFQPVPIAV